MTLGEKFGIMTKSGNSYKYGEETLGRGYDATREFLKENKKSRERFFARFVKNCPRNSSATAAGR